MGAGSCQTHYRGARRGADVVLADSPSLWPPLSALLHLHQPTLQPCACTCVNAWWGGQGRVRVSLALVGMRISKEDDGLESGWVSDVFMWKRSSFPKSWGLWGKKKTNVLLVDGGTSDRQMVPGCIGRGWMTASCLEWSSSLLLFHSLAPWTAVSLFP